jgi:hypothetical protein
MSAEPEFRIANEFASVTVRKIRTRNGERIEIESNGLGLKIQLDSLALESLTWQSPEMFSQFLSTPLEPHKFNLPKSAEEG